VIWRGEITLAIETFIDQFVRRKLLTVVVSDRLHPLLRGGQKPHNFRCYVGGILPFYLAYKCVLARKFDQRHKEFPVMDSAHEIRFPVADARLLFNDCRTLVNIDDVLVNPFVADPEPTLSRMVQLICSGEYSSRSFSSM